MFRRDGEDAIVGFIIVLIAIGFIIYITILLATVIAGVAAAGGTLFGGCSAIKNYTLSFKENVVDSNRVSANAA